MRALALGLSALLVIGVAGCADKEPVAKTSANGEAMNVAGQTPPLAAPAVQPPEPSMAVVEPEAPIEASGQQAAGESADLAAAVETPVDAARDAKEATEAAARKIFDATRSAALKLQEAGREAVQSVRRDGAEKPAEEPAPTVAN